MGTFTNNEDPDEMPLKAAKKKEDIFRQKHNFFLNYTLTFLDMYNGISQVYCIKPEGESISLQSIKGSFLDRKQVNSYLYEAVSGRRLAPIIYN